MDKYNQFELEVIEKSIRQALKEDLNKEERYCFLTNLSLVKSEINKLNEDLPEDVEGYQEYRNKVVQALINCGAEHEQTQNGNIVITDWSTLDKDKYSEKEKELNEEYSDILEEQQKVMKERNEKKNQKVSEIDWYYIGLDDIESSSENVLNENTFHLISKEE